MRIVRSTETDPLDYEMSVLASYKRQLARIQEAHDEQQKLVTTMMSDRDIKTKKVDGYQFTLVVGERTVIDELGIKKELGIRKFRKISKEKVDTTLLVQAINNGDLEASLLEKYAINVKNKPFVKVTELNEDE